MNKTELAKVAGVSRQTIIRWEKSETLASELAKRGFGIDGALLNQIKTDTKEVAQDPTPESPKTVTPQTNSCAGEDAAKENMNRAAACRVDHSIEKRENEYNSVPNDDGVCFECDCPAEWFHANGRYNVCDRCLHALSNDYKYFVDPKKGLFLREPVGIMTKAEKKQLARQLDSGGNHCKHCQETAEFAQYNEQLGEEEYTCAPCAKLLMGKRFKTFKAKARKLIS